MVSGLVFGLLLAWFLTLFNFDYIVYKGLNELFGLHTTDATYYLIFAISGIIYGIFHG